MDNDREKMLQEMLAYYVFNNYIVWKNRDKIRFPMMLYAIQMCFTPLGFGNLVKAKTFQIMKYLGALLAISVMTLLEPIISEMLCTLIVKSVFIINVWMAIIFDYYHGYTTNATLRVKHCIYCLEKHWHVKTEKSSKDEKKYHQEKYVDFFITSDNAFIAGGEDDMDEIPRGVLCNASALHLSKNEYYDWVEYRTLMLMWRYIMLIHYPTLLQNTIKDFRNESDTLRWGDINKLYFDEMWSGKYAKDVC